MSNKKDMALYQAQLAQFATNYAEAEAATLSGGSKLSVSGGQFRYKGEPLMTDALNVVVLSSAIEYAYYDVAYDPDAPAAPICYAVGLQQGPNAINELRPHAEAIEPQAPQCKGCEWDEFGSADTGRGKACKQTRRLMICLEDDLDHVAGADKAFFNVPVTSVKNWAAYVKQVGMLHKLPPFGVVTRIQIVPDPKTQFKIEFHFEGAIEDGEIIGQILEGKESFDKDILYGFSQPVEVEEAKPKHKATARKAPAKKTTAARSRARAKRT